MLFPGQPMAGCCPDQAKAEGTDAAGQGGKAGRVIKDAVDTSQQAGTQSGDRPAHQTRSQGADHPGVDHRTLKPQPGIGAADRQRTKNQTQAELL